MYIFISKRHINRRKETISQGSANACKINEYTHKWMSACICIRKKCTDPKKGWSGYSNGAEGAALQESKQDLEQHLAAAPPQVAAEPLGQAAPGGCGCGCGRGRDCDVLFPPSFKFFSYSALLLEIFFSFFSFLISWFVG